MVESMYGRSVRCFASFAFYLQQPVDEERRNLHQCRRHLHGHGPVEILVSVERHVSDLADLHWKMWYGQRKSLSMRPARDKSTAWNAFADAIQYMLDNLWGRANVGGTQTHLATYLKL